MHRSFLALTAAVLVVPAYADAGENEAEKLFRQVEKKLLDAKTVRVEFDLKTGKDEGGWGCKGVLVLGEGDKMRLDGDELKCLPRIGNGTKIYTLYRSGEPGIDDSPKGLGRSLRGLLARPGIMLDFDDILSKNAPKKTFKSSHFKLGPKDKLGDIEAQIIEYTVLVEPRSGRISLSAGGATISFLHKDPVEAPVKLWIDTKAGVPVKLEIRWAPAVANLFREYTETLRFTINKKVDEKLFVPPK